LLKRDLISYFSCSVAIAYRWLFIIIHKPFLTSGYERAAAIQSWGNFPSVFYGDDALFFVRLGVKKCWLWYAAWAIRYVLFASAMPETLLDADCRYRDHGICYDFSSLRQIYTDSQAVNALKARARIIRLPPMGWDAGGYIFQVPLLIIGKHRKHRHWTKSVGAGGIAAVVLIFYYVFRDKIVRKHDLD